MFKLQLKDFLQRKIVEALGKIGIREIKVAVSFTENLDFGDLTSNVALTGFKNLDNDFKKKFSSPKNFAESIVSALKTDSELATRFTTTVEGAGFINFFLSKSYLFSTLNQLSQGKLPDLGNNIGKKIVVEYSSPNIAKPFTVGHLRSTIIGDAIANLLESTGSTVYRDNHLGDWGSQFGKQIYAVKKWGDEDKIATSGNPLKELVWLYVKFHQEAEKYPELEDEARAWFKKLEEGDPEARRLWQKCIKWSLIEFNKIYDELGIRFTENNGNGYGESFFEDKMEAVIEELEKKNLLKENEGAKLVYFENNKYPPLMIVKKDGTTLYSTRDLAADKFRLEKYGKDVIIINEVGVEQTLYFKQLFEVEKMLGWYQEGQRVHLRHGHYRFKDKKMSTRKGQVIWLEDLLKMAEEKALTLISTADKSKSKVSKEEEIRLAKDVAVGALKWNDLKRNAELDIVFDWDEVLNMQGNSGPYLQYVYARTESILRKVKSQPASWRAKIKSKEDFNFFLDGYSLNQEEERLLRLFLRFEDVLGKAAESFSAHLVCNYLFTLAQSFNLFYEKHMILGETSEEFRVALTRVTGLILKKGLAILGIAAPEEM